ncbi:MAG: inner rane transporter RhtA [Chloroflexota bacterium]|jgi:inner membrane transporter RhtA|nr:inner rane transporter RhtA [Chloroflexota bacterium]
MTTGTAARMVPGPGQRAGAIGLMLASTVSTQLGAAYAIGLFSQTSTISAAFMRNAVGAAALVVLLVVRRGSFRGVNLRAALTMGVIFGVMNSTFYEGIARLPLGDAVAVEFIGPIAVAAILSPSRRDLLFVVLAAIGVVAISRPGPEHLDYVGLAWVLAAATCWCGYILMGRRIATGGRRADTLALSMIVASVVLVPPALLTAGGNLLRPEVLAVGALVGIMSSAIPYSVEMMALQRVPPYVFGVLLSLHPLMGAVAGYLVLRQQLSWIEGAGFVLVIAASLGVTLRAAPAEIAVEAPVPA